ncbi:outer membrane protein [Methylorubrum extorquens]|uniref:Porin family protein n=1 Tax=Methylorubrum extorquens TaxID=408 RepID=A0AAX3WI58_METEX|nr:porin family protein [Methylorubrum extorquens]WHQ70181.1 porin family protein [Methylorubrum extorquens]
MLKTVLARSAAAFVSTAAVAADLPQREQTPVFAQIPAFTWSGFYAGIAAGYAFSGRQTVRTTDFTPIGQAVLAASGFGAVRSEQEGATVAGGFGYNYQFTPGTGFVAGIETDIQYTDLDSSRATSASVGGTTFFLSGRQSLNFLGTVRGRLGYAFNRVLVYGTGGFAYGNVNYEINANVTSDLGTIPFDAGRFNNVETGYVYGGGVEYAMPTESFLNFFSANAVIIKAEYLHYDLGSRSVFNSGVGPVFGPGGSLAVGLTSVSRFRTEGNIVRAGVNYKFGTY